MTNTITRKDVVITSIILGFFFIGIPFLLWGVSAGRLNHAYRQMDSVIRNVLKAQEMALQNFVTAATQEQIVQIEISDRTGYFWWSDLKQDKTNRVQYYIKSYNTLQQICGTLADQLRSDQNKFILEYQCSFMLQREDDQFLKVDTNGFQIDTPHPDYLKDVAGLLSSSETLPINIHLHREERKLHVITLVAHQPTILLDLMLSQRDN